MNVMPHPPATQAESDPLMPMSMEGQPLPILPTPEPPAWPEEPRGPAKAMAKAEAKAARQTDEAKTARQADAARPLPHAAHGPSRAHPGSQAAETETPEPPAPRRRWWLWALLAAAAAAAGWYFLLREAPPAALPATGAAATATAPALPPGEFRLTDTEIRSLRIEPVAARGFRAQRVAEGRIAFNDDRSTPVFFPYNGGRVLRAPARLGDAVEAGAVLFEVESADLVTAHNTLLTALETLNKSRTQLDLAQRQERRSRSLFEARAASQADLETTRATLRGAEADVHAAQTALEAARNGLRVLGRSNAQIAQVEETRQVDPVVMVRAPLAGVVTQRRVGPGQWINNGATDPVFTISDLSTMWLVANIREMDVPFIRVGQTVEVRVGALPDRVFPARIANAASGLDPATRRLTVRAEILDPERLLKPEMFATFRIEVGEPMTSVGVPLMAMIYRGAEPSVWQALPDNRFILRRIETGMRDGSIFQVLSGLAPGDRIVTGGALFIDRAARID
jgi:cobalt-zinc-cadmium efflux system membrane fusion protein